MLFSSSDAILSNCKRYRYQLTRQWNTDLDIVVFIMLNPSTADANVDDPTIRRCINFAHSWGYGGIKVVNLFAWRATKPSEMKIVADPVGPENNIFIEKAIKGSSLTIVAWGAEASAERVLELNNLMQAADVTPHCLGVTKMGHPRHPLYVPRVTKAIPFIAS